MSKWFSFKQPTYCIISLLTIIFINVHCNFSTAKFLVLVCHDELSKRHGTLFFFMNIISSYLCFGLSMLRVIHLS